jgi:hypothetical protein
MKEVIERLRDDKEYYGEFGSQYLSNSVIGVLLSNPQDFGKTKPDSKNMAFGRLFHQLVLEPEKAKAALSQCVNASTRTTKIYKEHLEQTGLDFALLRHEADQAEMLASRVLSNIEFYDIINGIWNQFEVPAIGEIEGVMWKGKADIVSPSHGIVDLKTTSDINSFKYSAKRYNYDSQAYIYETLFGKPMTFMAVDKETGQLGIFTCSESFLDSGREKVKRAIEVYQRYFGLNRTESIENHFISEELI